MTQIESIIQRLMSKKIKRFITAYEQYLATNIKKVKKIDLRYTNGLAIEWKSPQFAQNMGQPLNANIRSLKPSL